MSTFEDFLKDCLDAGHKMVRLLPRVTADGSIAFYAHGQCGPTSGETFTGTVDGNFVSEPTPAPEPKPDEADTYSAALAEVQAVEAAKDAGAEAAETAKAAEEAKAARVAAFAAEEAEESA